MKKAFTLIELIVVIGIIGVLSGVLIAAFGNSGESARAAKCLSNLRTLSMSWKNESCAGSQEHLSLKVRLGGGSVKNNFYEKKGWVSSATQGLYPSESHQTFEPIGTYETDPDRIDYAVTNGWMYGAVGHDRSTYVCPSHVKKRAGKVKPGWSYLMSAYFGWDSSANGGTFVTKGSIEKPEMTSADRLLIFAEIPFQGPGDWFPDAEGGTEDTDGILQYKGCSSAPTAIGATSKDGNENIGGNHKIGNHWYAHVAFADGHVEKLRVNGLTGESLKELTTWLCEGVAVGYDGSKYEKIE